MCKLKIGDSVIISNKNLNKSDLEIETPYVIARITDNNVFLKVNESTIVGVSCDEVKKINPDYLKSNRYKLAKAVKESKYPATELSLALGHSMYYFGGETKESRFNSHGDFSEGRLIVLLGKLLEAEKRIIEDEKLINEINNLSNRDKGRESAVDIFNQDLKVTSEEVQGHSLPSVEDSEKGLKELAKKINEGVASIQILGSSYRKLGKTAEETSEALSEKAERKGAFILMSVIIVLILIFTYLAFK